MSDDPITAVSCSRTRNLSQFDSVKVASMFYIVYSTKEDPLMTMGDAVVPSLSRKDFYPVPDPSIAKTHGYSPISMLSMIIIGFLAMALAVGFW